MSDLPAPAHEGGAEGVSAHAAAGAKKGVKATPKPAPTTEEKPAEGTQPEQPKADSPTSVDSDAVPLAVDIGWTMAVLFGQLRPESGGPSDRLPTEHELPPDQRIKLETQRVNSLLVRLGALLPASPEKKDGVPSVVGLADPSAAAAGTATPGKPPPTPGASGATGGSAATRNETPSDPTKRDDTDSGQTAEDAFHKNLEQSNLEILEWLACAGRGFSLAYQLGRSLRDTANPPLRIAATTDDAVPNGVQPADIATAAATAKRRTEIEARANTIRVANTQAAEAFAGKKLTGADATALSEAAQQQAAPRVAALDAVTKQLSRPRVTKLQEWLSTLAPLLPTDSGAIVSASVGRWCDLTTTVLDPDSPGSLRSRFGSYKSQEEVAVELLDSLLPQGDAWLNLLVGTESSDGLLTPEGFVAAGEAALGRTARIIRRTAVHYWFALLLLAVVVAGVLYAASQDLSGAGKVWTQIAAVASALGVTARGIGTTMAKLSKQAEKPIFGLEKIDAMAWAVTSIPADLKLNNQGVRALRRSGITAPAPLGRV